MWIKGNKQGGKKEIVFTRLMEQKSGGKKQLLIRVYSNTVCSDTDVWSCQRSSWQLFIDDSCIHKYASALFQATELTGLEE